MQYLLSRLKGLELKRLNLEGISYPPSCGLAKTAAQGLQKEYKAVSVATSLEKGSLDTGSSLEAMSRQD